MKEVIGGETVDHFALAVDRATRAVFAAFEPLGLPEETDPRLALTLRLNDAIAKIMAGAVRQPHPDYHKGEQT